MKLSDQEVQTIVELVKKQPQTVQDIAKTIDRSWVTAEKYLHEIKDKTGLINLKTFREGTQAALKIVYYTATDFSALDDVKQNLAHQIMAAKFKHDFDFMDVFQFVHSSKKRATKYEISGRTQAPLAENTGIRATKSVFYFSGNLSFLSQKYGKEKPPIEIMEDQLNDGVLIKILCRVNISSLANIEKISHLLVKYPNQIEIHHRYQPLRGLIIDDEFARFKTWENKADYELGELHKSTRVYYEITDNEWISWLQTLFWKMWRSSIPYDQRLKEIQKIVG